MKILIVEDRLETIYGILDFCEDNGYAKEVIDNFELAVPKLKTGEYDLLILDLKKDPTEDYPGFEIFNKVWEERFLPVIVFSSYFLNMPEIIDHPFIKYFEKDKEEIYVARSIIIRESMYEKLEDMRQKYGISITKLINIAIKEGISKYDNSKK